MDLLIARIHKLDRAETSLHIFSQLLRKAKHFTVPNATGRSSNQRPAIYSYLWKTLELMVALVSTDLKESTGVLSSLPLLISGRSNFVKSHHWSR